MILSTMEQRTHFQPNLYAHVAHKGELLNRVPIGVPPPFSSISEGLVSMLKGPSSSVPAPASVHQQHHPAVLISGKIVEEIPAVVKKQVKKCYTIEEKKSI